MTSSIPYTSKFLDSLTVFNLISFSLRVQDDSLDLRMANFSQYGGVNPEWEELTKTTTIPEAGPAQGQSVEEYRTAGNEGRESASNQFLQSSGSPSMFRHGSDPI